MTLPSPVDPQAPPAPVSSPTRAALAAGVLALGLSAFLVQVLLMRELLDAFSGNELVFGLVLGNWMLLMGLGASLGRFGGVHRLRRAHRLMVVGQMLVALLPLASVFALRWLRDVVFVRGAAVGFAETLASCFVLLAPYCLVMGFLLTLATSLLAEANNSRSIGHVYWLDNMGDVAGGLAFTLVLVYWLNHFSILVVSAVVNLAAAGWVAWRFGRTWLAAVAVGLLAGVAALAAFGDLDTRATRLRYARQEVVFHGNSPYGSLVVTRAGRQLTFIENGTVLFSSQNTAQVEETVHYAMAQRPAARRVLLVGGGVSGTARELLKYPVESVDYAELDPLIVDVARKLLPEALDDRRIRVHPIDGRRLVKQARDTYDVVILDVPPPSTSQLNRFFTREFLLEVRRAMRPDGVVCFPLGEYQDYLGPEASQLVAVAHRTLASVFPQVLMIPGQRVFFLGSCVPLSESIAQRLEAAGVATRFVNQHYLKATITPSHMADLQRVVSDKAPLNEDFSPILQYYHLRYWMTQFDVRWEALAVGLAVAGLAYLVWLRPVTLAVFTGGFAASALEVVLLVAFQVLYGYVYLQVGLIVTMFMLGLAMGSFFVGQTLANRRRRDLAWLTWAIALLAAAIPSVLIGLARLESASGKLSTATAAVIPLLALLLAALVGMQFPLAGKLEFRSPAATSSRLYLADYLGAAMGAILVGSLLLPLWGVAGVCWATAGLCAISGLVVFVSADRSAR